MRTLKLMSRPTRKPAQAQVSKKLRFVNGSEFLNRLQFNHDLIVNNEVYSIATIQMYCFVVDREWDFGSKRNTAQCKFMTKTGLISRLQQTRSEFAMDFECCRNDLARSDLRV